MTLLLLSGRKSDTSRITGGPRSFLSVPAGWMAPEPGEERVPAPASCVPRPVAAAVLVVAALVAVVVAVAALPCYGACGKASPQCCESGAGGSRHV